MAPQRSSQIALNLEEDIQPSKVRNVAASSDARSVAALDGRELSDLAADEMETGRSSSTRRASAAEAGGEDEAGDGDSAGHEP